MTPPLGSLASSSSSPPRCAMPTSSPPRLPHESPVTPPRSRDMRRARPSMLRPDDLPHPLQDAPPSHSILRNPTPLRRGSTLTAHHPTRPHPTFLRLVCLATQHARHHTLSQQDDHPHRDQSPLSTRPSPSALTVPPRSPRARSARCRPSPRPPHPSLDTRTLPIPRPHPPSPQLRTARLARPLVEEM